MQIALLPQPTQGRGGCEVKTAWEDKRSGGKRFLSTQARGGCSSRGGEVGFLGGEGSKQQGGGVPSTTVKHGGGDGGYTNHCTGTKSP